MNTIGTYGTGDALSATPDQLRQMMDVNAPGTPILPDYAPVPQASFGPAVNDQAYYVGRVERNLCVHRPHRLFDPGVDPPGPRLPHGRSPMSKP